MIFIDNLSAEDLLVLTNLLAISIAKDRNSDQLNVLGNFFVGLGSLLLIIASQQQYLATLQQKNNTEQNNAEQNNTTPNDAEQNK